MWSVTASAHACPHTGPHGEADGEPHGKAHNQTAVTVAIEDTDGGDCGHYHFELQLFRRPLHCLVTGAECGTLALSDGAADQRTDPIVR